MSSLNAAILSKNITGVSNRFLLTERDWNPNYPEFFYLMGLINRIYSKQIFTITAEIHARSLANFYCQYADRPGLGQTHEFKIRATSQRASAIRQFVLVKNKLMSVFNASALFLTMNFVITLSK